jgi:hypothetical protein
MRFATRIFLSSFVPFAVLLAVSFWAIRASVIATVRDGLRASVRANQVTLAREQTRNEARNLKLLQGVAENPALKAGLQLLATERSVRDQARNTVQDQLSEICDSWASTSSWFPARKENPSPRSCGKPEGCAVNLVRLQPPQQGFFDR